MLATIMTHGPLWPGIVAGLVLSAMFLALAAIADGTTTFEVG